MDIFAALTLDYYMDSLVSAMSDAFERTYYGYNDTTDEGELLEMNAPRVVLSGSKDAGSYPLGVNIDQPFADKTPMAIYVETPFRVKNPGGSPDTVNGFTEVHNPMADAIREWLKANKQGVIVPTSIKTEGGTHDAYGVQRPRIHEDTVKFSTYWRTVFFVSLQAQEVT